MEESFFYKWSSSSNAKQNRVLVQKPWAPKPLARQNHVKYKNNKNASHVMFIKWDVPLEGVKYNVKATRVDKIEVRRCTPQKMMPMSRRWSKSNSSGPTSTWLPSLIQGMVQRWKKVFIRDDVISKCVSHPSMKNILWSMCGLKKANAHQVTVQ